MSRLLVVEDDSDTLSAIQVLLGHGGHEVIPATDGRSGLRLLHQHKPDALILDIGLPVMDGWQVLERVRDISDLPILILTGRGQEREKVRGLRAGADDYLVKPFSRAELTARVEALLRRAGTASWAEDVYDDGLIRVEPATRTVFVESQEIHLTPTEFRLLNTLVRHAGNVLSSSQLLSLVWDDPTGLSPERVKFAILRLRRRLNPDTSASPIEAVRGVGYRYRPPAQHQNGKDTLSVRR
ncbi:response regulator transcription factor [Planomonospora sp. ID82291]|uniref:response regulator transcription factor n=1 Tax=Planomonospora sp. ID82291 TaxID=2738136 RepID=UPI0018C39D5E|nr:response regulator transcription factor [Planomonospora sp. ID82291]MBG0818617.1 response regulator transcription factor [Planomonospora sp. ID82291]